MKKTNGRKKEGVLVMGALVASAAVGSPFTARVEAAPPARLRYEDAMAAVLKEIRWSHDDQAAQVAAPLHFNIAPGTLAEAIDAFEAQSGIDVNVTQPGIIELNTSGAVGVLSAEQAVQRLLAGTGLTYRFDGSKAATIDVPGQSEFVSVSGTASTLATPKFTTPLRDIPQMVTVIKSDVIQ